MTQTTLNYSAIIAALVSIGSLASVALGHPAIAAIINDPATANEATAAVGAVAALVSAFSNAVHVSVIHTPASSASIPVARPTAQ